MFTGIIEEVGRIRAIERQAVSARLTVAASKVLSDVHLGDSIAVNGVCLTVTSFGRDYFCAAGRGGDGGFGCCAGFD